MSGPARMLLYKTGKSLEARSTKFALSKLGVGVDKILKFIKIKLALKDQECQKVKYKPIIKFYEYYTQKTI